VKLGGEQLWWWFISIKRSAGSVLCKLQLLWQPRRRPSQQSGVPFRHGRDHHEVLHHAPDTQGRPTDGGWTQEETGFVVTGVSRERNEDELLYVYQQAAHAARRTTSEILESKQSIMNLMTVAAFKLVNIYIIYTNVRTNDRLVSFVRTINECRH